MRKDTKKLLKEYEQEGTRAHVCNKCEQVRTCNTWEDNFGMCDCFGLCGTCKRQNIQEAMQQQWEDANEDLY